MSKKKNPKKRNAPSIHTNKLTKSRDDDLALAIAVEERYLKLCVLYLNKTGEELVFPKDLEADVYRWRTMRVRHKKGDYRNTEDEFNSTKRIAQWTLDVKNELLELPMEQLDALT